MSEYDLVLMSVMYNGYYLKDASKKLKDDDLIVLAAIHNNCRALEYASDRLRDSEEIVLEAIKENEFVLCYASERLRSDKSFIIKLLMLFKNDKYKLNGIKKFINIDLKKELNL